MYLLIDPSERNQICLVLFDTARVIQKRIETSNRTLLASIDAFFDEQGYSKDRVAGIAVVIGAGAFTSTRIAVVVANTFGYVLEIPLLGVMPDRVDAIQDIIPELLAQPVGQYISATYAGEPSITPAA